MLIVYTKCVQSFVEIGSMVLEKLVEILENSRKWMKMDPQKHVFQTFLRLQETFPRSVGAIRKVLGCSKRMERDRPGAILALSQIDFE